MKLSAAIKSKLIKIGNIQTQIIMGLVYFLLIGPIAILFQIFRRRGHSGKIYWAKKEPITNTNFYLKKQF